MRALFFTLIIGIVVGHLASGIARAQDSISGTVVIDKHAEANSFGVHFSDNFDAEQTRARAESALAEGRFETAFHDFLAVCSTGEAESCLQAAQIAEAGHVPKVPKDLTEHLFVEACAGGVQEACDAKSGSE